MASPSPGNSAPPKLSKQQQVNKNTATKGRYQPRACAMYYNILVVVNIIIIKERRMYSEEEELCNN